MSEQSVLERLREVDAMPGRIIFQHEGDGDLDRDITEDVADAIAEIKRLEEEAETSDMVLIGLQRKLNVYTDKETAG